nr:bone morphogenetic protein 1 homolog [Lytechinus pictus]
MEIWIVFIVLVLLTGGTKSQDQTIYLSDEETTTITSPNYPGNYYNNADIVLLMIAPTGIRIRIQFSDFLIWYGDSLTVYLGLTDSPSDATWRATLSGSSLPDDISSTGSYMWLRFTSDDSVTRKGFSASVSTIEPGKNKY